MTLTKTRNRRRTDGNTPRVRASPGGLRWVAGLIAVVLLGAGGWAGQRWVMASPSFALKSVSVSGQRRAHQTELLKISGLTIGQSLFSIEVPSVERAIATHPWVRTVTVTRRFPAAASIEVVEHEPVAWAWLGELYLLDAQGEPFKKVTPDEALDLPLITGMERDEYVERPQEGAARFVRALEVAGAYGRLPWAKQARLSEVRLQGEAIVLVVGEGEEIRLGAGDAIARLSQLAPIREELMRRSLAARVIHLDNRVRPGWVTVQISTPRSERRESKSQ